MGPSRWIALMMVIVSETVATMVASSAYQGSRKFSDKKIDEFSVWMRSIIGVSARPYKIIERGSPC